MEIIEYKLGDLFSKKPQYGCNLSYKKNGRIKYLTQSDIDSTSYEEINSYLDDFEYNEKFRLNFDDFLMSRAGTIKSYYCNYNENVMFTGNLVRYTFNKKLLLHKYLYYWTLTSKAKQIFNKISKSGTTMPKLNPPAFAKIKILLPPISIQKQIINIIEPNEHFFKKYSNLIRIDDVNNTKHDIQKIINIIEPFNSYSNKLKENLNKIKNIYLKIINKNSYKKSLMIKNVTFEKGVNLKKLLFVDKKEIIFINVAAINEHPNKYVSYKNKNLINVNYGDVLISLDGTPGKVNNFLFGINGYGYKIFSKIRSNYEIYFSLLSIENQKIIQKYSNGTSIKHATKAKEYLKIYNFKNYEKILYFMYQYEIKLKKLINKCYEITNNLIEIMIL
ncbi:restriction endonuclease subunit S [Mycoplasmoides alvi]|uniref:restriction endonuclease subunit S n=1 Tax=Mycoplasmoides alvi TaxID=78580 RepID=UPI00051C3648|nr:restriction endonuclease subunit S [Mycoplasmoides alvi]